LGSKGGKYLRVISGLRKGHKLKTPKGINVRPTEDKTKESLFNILGHIDEDSIILDGFGGSGSIGIEFLSRGAKLCYFVDNSMDSINIIKENLVHTKLIDRSVVLKSDIMVAIRNFGEKKLKFNYIYIDPPFFKEGFICKILKKIDEDNILAEDGLIIIEHEKELELEDVLYNFNKRDLRRYGSKSLSFYRKRQ
jgi:16S rRNA (guanine(966)-N(2))-methyltransferase RsmD